jgi:RNA polymerase sigma-70 factor (sigma-E family)
MPAGLPRSVTTCGFTGAAGMFDDSTIRGLVRVGEIVGDEESFREFVRMRTPALSRSAYLLTGDHHLAHYLLQSALATIYQHWRRIAAGNPEAYVRRAMYHTHVSWWRRRRLVELGPADDVPATTRDESDAVTLRLTVAAALRQLAPRQRAVIVLRYFEDLTEAQTAEALGCAVGTVKRLHFDALARLREVAPYLLTETAEPRPATAPEVRTR